MLRTAPQGSAFLVDKGNQALYGRVVADLTIGPDASGDGDILKWTHAATLLLLADFLAQDQAQPFERSQGPERSSTRAHVPDLLDELCWMSWNIFYVAFPCRDSCPAAAWSELYSLLELDIKRLWGGRKLRIRKRAKQGDPLALVQAELRNFTPIKDIPARTGLSRANVYRVLGRKL